MNSPWVNVRQRRMSPTQQHQVGLKIEQEPIQKGQVGLKIERSPIQQRQADLKMGPREGVAGRTDTRGYGFTEQMDQPGRSSGKVPFQGSCSLQKTEHSGEQSLQLQNVLTYAHKTQLSHFWFMNTVGIQKKCICLFIHVGVKRFCLSTPLKEAVILAAAPGFYCIFSPGHVCLRNIALRASVSAVSSSILSWGRSTRNISRNREKGIHEMSAAVHSGVVEILF